jgi:hypothetical protein
MTLDVTDDEALALAQLLRRTIDDDHYPHEAEQGCRKRLEIGCRIGAKSGVAFRRNRLPRSTEISCRFAPIFAHVTSLTLNRLSPRQRVLRLR